MCWFLCGTATKAGESTTDDMLQGMNNVAVDFREQIVNNTKKLVSSDDHPTETWLWIPIGPKINDIKSESILHLLKNDTLFPDYSGSGEDDRVDDEPANETQKDEIWTFTEMIEERLLTTQSPKTLDRKRNEIEEKAYLNYERHLRKTNWCFKDTKDAKPAHKFKVKRL